MKLKPTVLFAIFLVTMGLLLVASTAQAATVITDGDGNVTRIENLEVFDDASNSTIFYNVDFVYDTAINVYSSGEFDFFPSENAVVALVAVNKALNAEDPIPPGAGPQGSDQFFIGAIEYFGRVMAAASENIEGAWDLCETDCLAGTAVLDPAEDFTYAKFTETQDVPPGAATLISPRGTIAETNPTYTWNAVADSTWYRLWVNDPSGDNIIDDWYTADGAGCGDGAGECSVASVSLLTDGSYQWWIQTWNEFGDGPWSAAMSFTVDTGTGALPGPATLISPSGSITENSPTYTWNAVADSTEYRLWVEDSTGDKVIDEWYTADTTGCGDGTGECSVTPETLLADDAYQWWIQTKNDSGIGPWSDSLSFTVDTGTSVPPGPATLISPSGTISDNTPTYTWNAEVDSTWYRLFVWDSTKEVIIDQWYTADAAGCGDGTGECTVTPATVLADRSHQWWIGTWNDFGDGPWSDPLSFTVDTGIGTNVILDENGNVTRIENLPVVDENTGDPTVYNVSFVYDIATNVYGFPLNFDFPDDEQIFIALEAVTDALNFNDPTPVGASAQGTDQFFIGNKEEFGAVVAVGGENIAGVWDQCETDCIAGVALLNPSGDNVTWALFQEVVAPNVVQVFITDRTKRGDFGGLAGGDAICQELAENAGLTGTWTAWLSTSFKDLVPGVDAIDRIPDGGPYQLVDGTVIADDKADLTDGTLNAPIDLNQFGGEQVGLVWTGTQPDGTDSGTNCNNWTEAGGSSGCTAGDPDCGVYGDNNSARIFDWTQASDNGSQCSEYYRLYCFGSSE